MTRALIACTALALLAGCNDQYPRPESNTTTGNGYGVTHVLTHDGCKVYRFRDDGYTRYFVRCDGTASAGVSWRENCGKGCTREVSVPTGGRQ